MDVYLAEQKKAISSAFNFAYQYGKNFGMGRDTPLDDNEKRFITYQVTKEMQFMSNFANDLKNGAGKMPYSRRMQMYVDSLDAMFGFGKLVYLPDDVKIFWKLGPTDKHCLDCIINAARSPYSKKTLPGFPKSGSTKCLSNCYCRLRYVFNTNQTSDDYESFLLSGKSVSPSRQIPTEEDYKHLMKLREDFYYNRYMYELTKDQTYQDAYKQAFSDFNSYKQSNSLYFPIFFDTKRVLRDLKDFSGHSKFELVQDILSVKKGELLSVFISDSQQYATVTQVLGNNIIVKLINGIEVEVSPTSNIIFKEK